MSRIFQKTLALAIGCHFVLLSAGTADAFLFNWLCPNRNCGTQSSYRTVMMPVPVTSFQPVQSCGTTCMQPCTTTQWQVQRVPVQTFLSMPTWTTTTTAAPTWSAMSPVMPTAPACSCGSCATCGFAPATTTSSEWQPVNWSTGTSAACPSGNCSASTVGYATAADFSNPASTSSCNCSAGLPASTSLNPISSTNGARGTTTTPWEPATPTQQEQWQQQNGQRPESENRPDLNLTPPPVTPAETSATSWNQQSSPSDWRPLQAASQPTTTAQPLYRPIPVPSSIRPMTKPATRPQIEQKPDALLDRGTLHTASRQYRAIPIRWEDPLSVQRPSSDEGGWRSVAP